MKQLLWAAFCIAVFGSVVGRCPADTWRLDQRGSWQNLEQDPQGRYLLQIAEIKQQIVSGNRRTALAALKRLKQDFGEQFGPELDAFIAAEKLFVNNKLGKAVKKYQLFLKNWPLSPLASSADERLFSIATAFLQGQKRIVLGFLPIPAFDDGAEMMQTLADRYGNGPLALRALTGLAQAYEKKRLFPDAYRTWAQIADLWPTGQTGQEALLRMAKTLHAAYNGPQYDAGWLASAKSYYQDYQARYPQQAQQAGVENTLELIGEQQAYKDYCIADYYRSTDHIQAANLYETLVAGDWPGTAAATRLKERAAEAAPQQKTWRRKMFDLTGRFFDNWFGLALLVKSHPTEPNP